MSIVFNMTDSAAVKLVSLSIKTPPTKTSYTEGESFSTSGMVVQATYSNGVTAIVTGYSYSPTGALTASNTSITISYTEGGVTVTATQTISVYSMPAAGTSLENCTWEEIRAVSDLGLASNYFAVGDRKSVAISGTVGQEPISGTYYVYIIGISHNGAANTIDFGTFKNALSGGRDIVLIDGGYGNEVQYASGKYFNMNRTSQTNKGGWKSCILRYDILGSTRTSGGDAPTNTATSPVSGTLMAALPSALRAVMKPMTVYTDNTANGTEKASNVTATVDYLPLLAEFELYGTRTYANSAEQNYQAQYAYYTAVNYKWKYGHRTHDGEDGYVSYWMRSPRPTRTTSFCHASGNGAASDAVAGYSYGLSPIFRV